MKPEGECVLTFYGPPLSPPLHLLDPSCESQSFIGTAPETSSRREIYEVRKMRKTAVARRLPFTSTKVCIDTCVVLFAVLTVVVVSCRCATCVLHV